jgi:hypothetical protein
MSFAATPTSVNHSPLFNLPRELRDLVYELVFEDMTSNPLYIRKFAADPQWKVCYNPHARVPGLLLTSKAICAEAKSCLYSSCNPPRVVVDGQDIALHVDVKQPEEVGKQRGYAVRDLETIVPLLATVDELNLEIKALDGSPLLLLVRWIRAVLNGRKTQLRKASIGVHVSTHSSFAVNTEDGSEIYKASGGYDGPERYEVMKEAARISTRNSQREEIWILKKMRWDSAQGPPFAIAWRGRHAIQAEAPDPLPCSVAWQELVHGRSQYWVGTYVPTNMVVVRPSS